jgi:hypothetical protein
MIARSGNVARVLNNVDRSNITLPGRNPSLPEGLLMRRSLCALALLAAALGIEHRQQRRAGLEVDPVDRSVAL